MALNSIGGDLQRSLHKAGIVEQIEAVQVCELWGRVIAEIFGAPVAEKTQALYFKRGTLTVAVLHPVLAQEFRFKEEELLEKLNRRSAERVRKIRFEV